MTLQPHHELPMTQSTSIVSHKPLARTYMQLKFGMAFCYQAPRLLHRQHVKAWSLITPCRVFAWVKEIENVVCRVQGANHKILDLTCFQQSMTTPSHAGIFTKSKRLDHSSDEYGMSYSLQTANDVSAWFQHLSLHLVIEVFVSDSTSYTCWHSNIVW